MKTVVGNLFAVSTLTAFIASSVPAVSALSVQSSSHVVRHLNHAHLNRSERKMKRQRCNPRPPPSADNSGNNNNGGGNNGGGNNGGSNNGGGNNGGGNNGGGNNGGGNTNNGGGSNNGGGGSSGGNGGSSGGNGGSSGGNGGSTGGNGGSSGGNGGSSGNGGGGYTFGGKKGLAFPMGCSDLDKWHPRTDIYWTYNWRGLPYGDCPPGMPPFVPMLWGYAYLQSFIDMSNMYTPEVVLFVNEPNEFNASGLSSGLTPDQAAELWHTYIQPLRQRGTRIGSAATTSNPNGIQWEKDFEAVCGPSCIPDFDCIHYYDTSVQGFIDYATNWHNTFGRNIWVTEIACQSFTGGEQCDEGQIYNFISGVAHFCETTPWIEAYTFFGAMSDVQNVNYLNKMMNDQNGPNALGYHMLAAH